MTQKKDKRSAILVTSEFRVMYEALKAKGFNFASLSAKAIREAMVNGQPLPKREPNTGTGFQRNPSGYVGVTIPADIAKEFDQLTKPTNAKAAYIREAIATYVKKHKLL